MAAILEQNHENGYEPRAALHPSCFLSLVEAMLRSIDLGAYEMQA